MPEAIDVQVTVTGPLGRRRPVVLTIDSGTPVTILNVDVANLVDLTADRMTGPSRLLGPLGLELGYRIPATSMSLMGHTLCDLEIRCHVLAEGLTCLVGLVSYMAVRGSLNWSLALPLTLGALLSVPFAAWAVSRVNHRGFTTAIGIFTVLLGILALTNRTFRP